MKSAEIERLMSLYSYESGLRAQGAIAVAGLDEVGRGSVAGPLSVGACILEDEPLIEYLNDSKKLTSKRREIVACELKETGAIYAIAHVEPSEIDRIGMSAALKRAMVEAVGGLLKTPDTVLLDGNPLGLGFNEINIVKGDAKIACIAAASVLAKTTRDAMMVAYDDQYPEYGFSSNKGYASASHIAAIKKYGLSPLHRATFCKNFTEPTLF